MLSQEGIGGKKYATVMTDKATSARWVYFHEQKGGAYNAVLKFVRFVLTQFKMKIKKWRLDGGKEYSPSKMTDMAEDLGQIVEITTPYNPEQDGTSERSIRTVMERTRSPPSLEFEDSKRVD